MKKAFTLAELLIALTIVGVVAILTVPHVVKNAFTRANVAVLQQTYTKLSETLQSLMLEERIQILDDLDLPLSYEDETQSHAFMKKYFDISKDCGDSSSGCFAASYKDIEDGRSRADLFSFYEAETFFILNNGAAIAMTADIAGLPIDVTGDARFHQDSIYVKGNAKIDRCRMNDILRFWGRQLIPALSKLKTDATISMNADVDGWYNAGTGSIPAMDVTLNIPESPISHSGIRMDSNIAADIRVKGGGGAPADLIINDFHTKGKALDIALKGSASDLLGDDPLFDIDGGIGISLDTLGQFIRKSTGLAVSGRLSANAKGRIRMSQISPYAFADADLTGFIRSDRLDIHSEKDSIDLSIDSLDIVLATMGNRYDRRVEEGTRMIALSARLDSTSIRYKDAFSVSGSGLSLKAQNDAAILDAGDSSSCYPFGGKLEIGRLSMTDSDSSRIVLRNSTNTFRISPSKADKEIPVLSLKSDSKAIRLRAAFDRASIRDLGINIVATKSDARRKRMARAFVDSLARRFPDVPRDSLFSHLRKMRGTVTLPDWLSEQDFRKNDLNFKLGDSMAKYFREWDFYGDLKFRRASVMTPAFPLRTSLNDFDGYITNNELTLRGFTLRSGRSDIEAAGRRALAQTAWRIEGTLREFARFEPVNLWFDYPIHRIDKEGRLKGIKDGDGDPGSAQYATEAIKRQSQQRKEKRGESIDTAFSAVAKDGQAKLSELAEYLGASERTVKRWISESNDFINDRGNVSKKS